MTGTTGGSGAPQIMPAKKSLASLALAACLLLNLCCLSPAQAAGEQPCRASRRDGNPATCYAADARPHASRQQAGACKTISAERKDRMLTVGGYRIAVSETGCGPDMIILHGRNYSREMMQSLVDHYKDRFRVVTYDALGHGQSSKPAAFTLTDQSDVLTGVVKQLRLHKPVAIGFSMGSYITLLTAERRPKLFSRMVLIGTRGLSETGGSGRIFAPQTSMEQITAFDKSVSSPVKLTDADKESIGRSLQRFDLITDAPKAAIPALVLTGQYDGLNTPAEGRRVAEALPNARFHEIPDAGHIAFFENPDAVFQLTDAFIDAK